MFRKLYIVIVGLLLLIQCESAGVARHFSLLTRIINNDIKIYIPWLKTGAFFPDSLYSCDTEREDWKEFAEFTHWPKFVLICLKYWKEKYADTNQQDSPDAQILKSFIMGVFSHQISDVSWHSLVEKYRDHGLLKVLSEIEFDGDNEKAHNFIDVMGDFYTLNNWVKDDWVGPNSWDFFSDSNWILPKEDDMMEIIKRANIMENFISYEQLKLCVSRGMIALAGEVFAIKTNRANVLRSANKNYPIVADYLQDYWLGGEWDTISTLNSCMSSLNNLFENDQLISDIDTQAVQLCRNLPQVDTDIAYKDNELPNKMVALETKQNGVKIVSPWVSLSNFGTSMTVGNFKDDGEQYLAVSAPIEDSRGSIYMIPWYFIENQGSDAVIQSQEPVTSMFGKHVDRYPIGDTDILVVSEPGSNSIKFFIADDLLLTIFAEASPEFTQLQVAAISDLNNNGFADIILSSPSFGIKEQGNVFIINGKSVVQILLNGRKRQEIAMTSLNPIKFQDFISSPEYSNFGSSVGISNEDSFTKYIYVTAQNTGTVYVFQLLGQGSYVTPKYAINGENVKSCTRGEVKNNKLVPSKTHGMFGKVLYSWQFKSRNFIAITQPLFNNIFIFEETETSVEFIARLSLNYSLRKVPNNHGFGEAIGYDEINKSLFITSPNSFSGTGALFKIALSEILGTNGRNIVIDKDHLYYVNIGDTNIGMTNFGKSILIGPNSQIVVGEPQYGYGNVNNNQLTGAILVL